MYIHIHLQIYNEYKNISSTSFHLEIIPYAEYRKILALVLFFPLSTLLPMSEFMTWWIFPSIILDSNKTQPCLCEFKMGKIVYMCEKEKNINTIQLS